MILNEAGRCKLMKQTVVDFANSKQYDEDSINLDYFKNVIYENNFDLISNIINELDTFYEANGLISENIERFIIEVFEIPEDYDAVNALIQQIIIENEIENEEQFQELVAGNDLDINYLMANGLAYVDNNIYSTRHYILKYLLDIDAYQDYLAELQQEEA